MYTPNCPAYFDGGFQSVPPRRTATQVRPQASPPRSSEIELFDGCTVVPGPGTAGSPERHQPVELRVTVQLVLTGRGVATPATRAPIGKRNEDT